MLKTLVEDTAYLVTNASQNSNHTHFLLVVVNNTFERLPLYSSV